MDKMCIEYLWDGDAYSTASRSITVMNNPTGCRTVTRIKEVTQLDEYIERKHVAFID